MDARCRVYDSPQVGFFKAYAQLYGVRLCRPIEMKRGITRVRKATLGSSTIAWGETVFFSRLRRCPQRRLLWPAVPSMAVLSRYKEKASPIAPSGISAPVVAPLKDIPSVPAIPSAVHRLSVCDLLVQLLSMVAMQFLWLANGAVSSARWICSWIVSRRVTLTSLLRATYGGVVDMCMSMGHDSAWFSHCLFSVAAELLAAVTAFFI